jgi:NAD(P)-dependent dehydrogenase (short-subunit alcohol dehydrogenase family)
MFEFIADNTKRIDILVNSASSFHKQQILDVTPDDWDRVMAINLRAPFFCIQHAAKLMDKTKRESDSPAAIVNISDLSGVYPWLNFSHHGISKAGLIHLTKVAARELAPTIRTNAIIPGPILPPPNITERSEKWREMTKAIPLQRSGHPRNISQTVIYLVNNDFVTGSIINVDGGESLIGSRAH